MPDLPPSAWMPRDRWEALVRGDGCPLCAAVAATEPADTYGHTIADLPSGRLRLAANQFSPGYCVFISHRHVREPYDLPAAERAAFFADMMRVAEALERIYQPTKMNFQLLGNAVPHLHCHLIPRYYGDPAPGRPLDLNLHSRTLTPADYAERARQIKIAL